MSIQSNFPNVKPSLLLDFANTKQLDNRVTFTRSTPAVYYDGETTAMAEQNLFTYSQAISNWARFGSATATDNYAVAPDGTTTATRFQASSDGSGVYQLINTPDSTVLTSTVYMKSNTGSSQTITLYGNGGGVQTQMTVTTSWQRFTLTFTQNSTKSTGIYRNTGDNATDVLMWGGQIEARSSATAYTATTTQPITNYIPVLLSAGGNQARFDHNPTTGESLGLLIEEQRTNLFTYSSDLSNAAWTKTNATITSNTIVAPDGTLTGDKIVADSTSGVHFVYQAATSAGSRAFSCYLKKGEYSFVALTLYTFDDTAKFNLDTGVVVSVSGNMTSATIQSVGNGWYRCTCISSNTPVSYQWIISPLPDSTNLAYIGNSFNGIYAWGAQVEAGAFASSYIATTSASATRTADAASMTGTNFSSWFNNAEGTMYGEALSFGINGDAGGSAVYGFSGDTTANRIRLNRTGSTSLTADIGTSSGTQVAIDSVVTNNAFFKNSFAYKFNDSAASTSGGTVGTDTSCSIPVVTQFQLGVLISTGPMSGYWRKFAYYPIKLSNTNLVALTS